MKKLICILLALLSVVSMTSCSQNAVDFFDFLYGLVFNDAEYKDSSNWNCTNEEFETIYVGEYTRIVEELANKYGINYNQLTKAYMDRGDFYFWLDLYSDEFTVELRFVNLGSHGKFHVNLYYFSQNIDDLNNYEKQKKYVDFINDLTNVVAFDTKTDKNHFERLYAECEYIDVSYIYHFDHIVGEVGYVVSIGRESDGYYYKMQENEELEILSNRFTFDGILKPLVLDS